MIRCPDGHFYDPAKHNACPWCARPLDMPSVPPPPPLPPPPPPLGFDPNAGKTKPVAPPADSSPSAIPTSPQAGVTRRVAPKELGIDPVVGWLVCIDGKDKGRDYRIHTERNFIGRAPSMDICIGGDDTISRERHAILTFDPKKREFWIQPGESTGLVYLNGNAVYVPQPLKPRDVIEIGQTKLTFVPFVDLLFQWQ